MNVNTKRKILIFLLIIIFTIFLLKINNYIYNKSYSQEIIIDKEYNSNDLKKSIK